MVRRQITRTKTRRRARTSKPKMADDIAATIAAIDKLKPATAKAARVVALLKTWLSDESGYDEETWPQLKKALNQERKRVGARRLFDG